MKQTIRTYLLATAMGALAVAPAATVMTFGSSSAAYAKSENGKGNGNGGGSERSSSQGNKGNKGGNASSKGGGGGNSKSSARSSGGDPVGDFFRKLTGQEKKAARVETRSASASAKSGKPAKGSGMHPSELGNMNGALNANMNAVLAHIRNGNTNGPVGHLAALAVAGAGAAGAQEIIDLAAKFQALDDALLNPEGTPFASLEEYLAAKAGTPGVSNDLIDAKLEELANLPEGEDDAALIAELNDLLEGAGYGGEGYEGEDPLADYLADKEGVPGIEPVGPIEDALAALRDSEGMIPEEPDPEAVAEAEEAIGEKGAAESSILAYWNKNDDNPEEITEAEQALLDKLYDRLVGYEDAIAGAMASGGTEEADEGLGEGVDEDLVECEDPTVCEEPAEPEELAAAE